MEDIYGGYGRTFDLLSILSTNSSSLENSNDDGEKIHPILVILLAAVASSLEILLAMGIGVILAHPKINILTDPVIRRGIGKTSIYVFMPLFMVKNFATTMSLKVLSDIYIIPIFGLFHLLLSYIISEMCFPIGLHRNIIDIIFFFINRCKKCNKRSVNFVIKKKTRKEQLERFHRSLYVFCSCITNAAFLPIVYAVSIAENSKVFSIENVGDTITSFISLYSIFQFFFFFGYVFNYLRLILPDEKKPGEMEIKNRENEESKNSTKMSQESDEVCSESKNIRTSTPNACPETEIELSNLEIERVKDHNPVTQDPGDISSKFDENENKSDTSNDESSSSVEEEENENEKKEGVLVSFFGGCLVLSKMFLNPVMIGIVIGFIIAFIPKAKDFIFFDNTPIIISITNVIVKMSNVALGIGLVVSGANLGAVLFPVRENEKIIVVNKDDSEVGKKKEKKYIRIILACCSGILKYLFELLKPKHVDIKMLLKCLFIKLVFFPILTFGIVCILMFGFGKIIIKNEEFRPIVYLVFLLEGTVPLMLNINVICTMLACGVDITSELILYQYILAPFTMAVFSTAFLYFICSFEKCNL